MKYLLLLVISLLSGCASVATNHYEDDYYINFDGTALWFSNMDSPKKAIICSGHTCLKFSDTPLICDDEKYYCINGDAIKFSIPRNIKDIIPEVLTHQVGEENEWSHNNMRHKVWPWGKGRAIYNTSKYEQEASLWGAKNKVYSISSYEEGSDRAYTTVLYSIEYGVLGLQGTYADGNGGLVYENYLLEGKCGYLASAKECG